MLVSTALRVYIMRWMRQKPDPLAVSTLFVLTPSDRRFGRDAGETLEKGHRVAIW
jgi:hypothetical protein